MPRGDVPGGDSVATSETAAARLGGLGDKASDAEGDVAAAGGDIHVVVRERRGGSQYSLRHSVRLWVQLVKAAVVVRKTA